MVPNLVLFTGTAFLSTKPLLETVDQSLEGIRVYLILGVQGGALNRRLFHLNVNKTNKKRSLLVD